MLSTVQVVPAATTQSDSTSDIAQLQHEYQRSPLRCRVRRNKGYRLRLALLKRLGSLQEIPVEFRGRCSDAGKG